jgi:HlyD family secretion protein
MVTAGEELAHLDRTETLARRAQAGAAMGAAQARLAELERGYRTEEIAQGRSARDAAGQRRDDAQRDLERTQQLRDAGAVSQEALDKAELAFKMADSQFDQAEDQLRLLEAGPRSEQVAAQRAFLAQAEGVVEASDAALANLTIRAPFDGVVTGRNREPGEIIPAGSPVVTLLDRNDRWVRIYVPETRMGAVHVGQAASLSSDTFRGRTYPGEVVYISSEAEFTPKTVQTNEERVKLVYAVKVRVTGDPGFDLKPGLPVDVRIDLTRGVGGAR